MSHFLVLSLQGIALINGTQMITALAVEGELSYFSSANFDIANVVI